MAGRVDRSGYGLTFDIAVGTWPQEASDLIEEKLLGNGTFGEVWKCRLANENAELQMPFALKKVPVELLRRNNLTQQMEKEVAILRSLKHRHIVRLIFDFRDSTHYCLGLEYATGGSMYNKLSKHKKFSLEMSAQYFYEVCDALEYVHNLPDKVVHRDIKPENVLITAEGHAQLADFGSASMMENLQVRGSFVGTTEYLSPEMILGEGHNETLDMWAMGVLLYEMVTGKSPFAQTSQERTMRLIADCILEFPANIDADVRDCIKQLCRKEKPDRLTASQAKVHPFVNKHYKQSIVNVAAAVEVQVINRKMEREKGILEGEIESFLKAKMVAENYLMEMHDGLEETYKTLKREQQVREAIEKEVDKIKETDTRLASEREELLRSADALAQELSRLKHAGSPSSP